MLFYSLTRICEVNAGYDPLNMDGGIQVGKLAMLCGLKRNQIIHTVSQKIIRLVGNPTKVHKTIRQ